MNKTLVSVIIPTFNREDVILETLNSVLMQSYENWECIIIDDGSSDKTVDIIKTYTEKDIRFKPYTRPANRLKGASSCRNYGLELSQGELIQFLDSDDLLESNKLEEQVKLYRRDLTLFTCKWGGFDNTSDLKKRFKYKYQSYRNFNKGINLLRTFGKKDEYFPPHVYLTPKALIEKAGSWNEELTNNDDAEFFTRIILSAKQIRFTPQTTVYYRYSGSDKLSNFTNEERVRSAIKSWKLIECHILHKYPSGSSVYVENAKRFLKEIIQQKYPELIKEEELFFMSQRPLPLFRKMKHNVSDLLSKIFHY